jgi:hypothetical protein
MVGARTAVLLVPPTIYLLSNFHRVAPAVVAADLMKAFSITAASLGTLGQSIPTSSPSWRWSPAASSRRWARV